MKTKFLSLLAILAIATGCSTTGGYQITVDLPQVSGKVYLNAFEGKQPIKIDSTEAVNGKFKFKGSLPQAQLASLENENGETVTIFFLDNADINIAINETGDGIAVTGSPATDLYMDLTSKKSTGEALEAIEANLDSPVSAYVFFRNISYKLSVAEIESLIAKFPADIAASSYIRILKSRVESMKLSEVGQQYRDIALPNPDGEIIKLSTLIEEGNYVLLDFWASWCPPCRAENPHVVEAYNEFKDKNFTVYGVSLDKPNGKEDWVKAIESDGLNWSNVSDLKHWNCAPAAMYGVSSIPSNFLISPDGVIVGKNLRGEALTKKLDELLSK